MPICCTESENIMTSRRIKFPIVILVMTICLISVLFYVSQKILRIKRIIIVSKNYPVNQLNIFNQKNILLVDLKQSEDLLMNANYFIKSVRMEKVYPDKLIIRIEPRLPVARVKTKTGNFTADPTGIILPARGYSGLPLIGLDDTVIFSGYKGDWRITRSLDILYEGGNEGINITQIIYDSNRGNFLVTLEGGAEVNIPSGMDTKQLVTSLQLIVSRFRIEGKIIKKIDFNYEKPVVVLANEEKNSSK